MKRLVLGGVLLYFLLLLATAPAAALFWLIGTMSPFQVSVQSSSGTLWHGQAQGISLSAPNQPNLLLGDVTWSLSALRLLTGALSGDLHLTGISTGQAEFLLAPGLTRVERLDLRTPAALLTYFYPAINIYPPEGMLHLQSKELILQEEKYQGQAKLRWEQASMVFNHSQSLGHFSLDVSATGKNLALNLTSSPSNTLRINGNGTWSKKSGLSFNGVARASASEQELAGLLALLGTRQADGSYLIQSHKPAVNPGK